MADWIDVLESNVVSWWAVRGRAFPMALAPATLKAEGVDYQAILNGRKLREAISTEGATKLRVVQNPADKLSWGLVPAGVTLDADLSKLFATAPEEQQPPQIRFMRPVWAAFARRLNTGMRRFFVDSNFLDFVDIGSGEMPPGQGVEVLSSDLPEATLLDSPNRDAEIIKAITAWAKAHNIPLDSLDQLKYRQASHAPASKGGRRLDLSAFSEEDLRRIKIPLDLVLKLRFE
ncbi:MULTISPECIES: hypothetical protein [unclassified Bradyrhizobium]|uniref:hypothetical protein n=1 Tax=unclassified Bradyrhizobium TaxID=2631580 RepID=UPI0023055F66|nr:MULTISPECIES: hypothetical protein [unclassified Bradyrhizobium]MDA9450763.1 hypothetical protein [Bradyrhizobium sp. CCBAU 21360]MDA9458514.1 hypothetical protein [Bradyrhizobium sp. CCBAU 21359]MDA9517782.1 hypothetical protein [Bradyrhizobium sp. CCBAU 11430]